MRRCKKLFGAEAMEARAMMAADIVVDWKSFAPDSDLIAKQAEIIKLQSAELDDTKITDFKVDPSGDKLSSELGKEPLESKLDGALADRLRPSLYFDNDGVVSESQDGKTTAYVPADNKTLDVLIEYEDGNLTTVILGEGWIRMVTQDDQGVVSWYGIFNGKGELVIEIVDGRITFFEDADATEGGGQVFSTHDGTGEVTGHSEVEVEMSSGEQGNSTTEDDGPISYGSPAEEDTQESQQEQEDDPLVWAWEDDNSGDGDDDDTDEEDGGDADGVSGDGQTGITEDPDDPSGDGEGDPEVDDKLRGDGRRDPQDDEPDSGKATLGYVGGSTITSGRTGTVTNPGEEDDKYGTKPVLASHLIDFVLGDGLFDPKPLF